MQFVVTHLLCLKLFANFFYSYAGDCDITFMLSGMKGGIKDFQVNKRR